MLYFCNSYHLNHTFSIGICISDAMNYKTKYFLDDLLGGSARLYTYFLKKFQKCVFNIWTNSLLHSESYLLFISRSS